LIVTPDSYLVDAMAAIVVSRSAAYDFPFYGAVAGE